MASEAERKLTDGYGWTVEEVDFGREDEPDAEALGRGLAALGART
jgi:hypothetical protein